MASSALLGLVVLLLVFPGDRAVPFLASISTALTAYVYSLPGIALGSLLGTAFGRAIGSRKSWYFGGLAGLILGLISLSLLASDLTLRGITLS